MADYKESTIAGTSWTRARGVYFENPLEATPGALIREEEILNLGERRIAQPAGEMNITMDETEMAAMIPMRNPADGELTGDFMPVATVYQAIYSWYWMKGLQRDAQAAAQTP
jgi:hypothetical protein